MDEDGKSCPDCHGARLNSVSRSVKPLLKKHITTKKRKSQSHSSSNLVIPNFEVQIRSHFPSYLNSSMINQNIKLNQGKPRNTTSLKELLPEIEERMHFMNRVGLGYLSLDRATATLSGGEAQRIRLAAQLGSNLSGVLYVLDEPSIAYMLATTLSYWTRWISFAGVETRLSLSNITKRPCDMRIKL